MGITAREFLESQIKYVGHFDEQVLLAHILGITRSQLVTRLDAALSPIQFDSAQQAFSRLIAGEPLPYILGHWEFFGLDFDVTKDVLIPRPETELLVEKAIQFLKKHPEKKSIADIGTGSGAIAISIAKNIPKIKILATDILANALIVARRNAVKHRVENQIEFAACDLLPKPQVKGQKSDLQPANFNLVCANLPYIPTKTLHSLEIFGKEPTLALDGGNDGLDLYRKLFSIIPKWLAPGGVLYLEIEATQGKSAVSLAQNHFANAEINLHQDLAGKDRLVEILT